MQKLTVVIAAVATGGSRLPNWGQPSPPFPSLPFPSFSLPFPSPPPYPSLPLEVGRLSGVWGGAPVGIEFGAF